jgi:adenosylhomocysteinase
MLVDDGGDATLLIHEGVKAEALFAKDGTLPDPDSTDNPEFKIVLRLIRDGLAKNPQKWTKMAKQVVGVSEETTTGVKRLYEMQVGGGVHGRMGAWAQKGHRLVMHGAIPCP